VTILGIVGEIELLEMLQKYDLKCMHRLEQSKITNFIVESDPFTRKSCEQLLRRNRRLPRDHLTYQVDLFAWKQGHWAAMAIEEKDQTGARKELHITKDHVTIKAICKDGVHEYRNSGRNLYLQCRGEALLSQAFCYANDIDSKVLPIGVVSYDIVANRKETDWAYHRGVFFVNKRSFEWFLSEYLEDSKWIRKVTNQSPKIAYNKNYFSPSNC
jgi:hypothetical protein